LTERSARGTADLAEKLRGRMAALARAHDLTLPDLADTSVAERTTTLFALLEAVLAPHADVRGVRTNVGGTDVSISGGALTSLALVLNEFATNSAKYGCLSAEEGMLSVEIVIDGENLVLTWSEAGGPVVGSPATGGFGGQLERASVEVSLRGRIQRKWDSSGLIITLQVPLSQLSG
jgi:two-component sensor histidine kinase